MRKACYTQLGTPLFFFFLNTIQLILLRVRVCSTQPHPNMQCIADSRIWFIQKCADDDADIWNGLEFVVFFFWTVLNCHCCAWRLYVSTDIPSARLLPHWPNTISVVKNIRVDIYYKYVRARAFLIVSITLTSYVYPISVDTSRVDENNWTHDCAMYMKDIFTRITILRELIEQQSLLCWFVLEQYEHIMPDLKIIVILTTTVYIMFFLCWLFRNTCYFN